MAGESPAQPGGPLAGLTAGSRVAGYLLEKLVGVGGMAAVFRARDERLGRVVARKLLAGDEVVRKRFVREARAVAAVDHPHIIPVYEAGEAFYTPAGHCPVSNDPGTEFVMFSPAQELRETEAVMGRNLRAMQVG